MKRENILKDVNAYAILDVAAVGVLVGLVLFLLKQSKLSTIIFATSSAIAAVDMFLLTFGKAFPTKVENGTGGTIFAKDEEGDGVREIAAGGTGYAVDGFKVGGNVYKVPDGVHVAVDPDGSVRAKSVSGKVFFNRFGGLLKSEPDSGWSELFRK